MLKQYLSIGQWNDQEREDRLLSVS
jgi:hypothetical protein